MSNNSGLVDNLRRLMHPERQPALAPAQARGALAGERGYVEAEQLEPGGGGGGCNVTLSSSDGLFTLVLATP